MNLSYVLLSSAFSELDLASAVQNNQWSNEEDQKYCERNTFLQMKALNFSSHASYT
jgi:hypothetical protein